MFIFIATLVSSACIILGAAAIDTLATPNPGAELAQQGKNQKILLYNWVPGAVTSSELKNIDAEWYVKVHGNVLPQEDQDNGVVNPDDILRVMATRIDSGFSGYGMLSFEGGFWRNLKKGPGDPDYERTVDSMINLIRVLKKHYPETKWSYWGLPDLLYWVPNGVGGSKNWNNVNEEERGQFYAAAAAIYQPIANEVDWLSPWVYDTNEHALAEGRSWVYSQPKAQRNWCRAKIDVCNIVNAARPGGRVPVIPTYSTNFAPGGNASIPAWVPNEELQSETVEACVDAGADGMAMWTSLGYRLNSACRYTENDHQADITAHARKWLNKLLFGGLELNWDSARSRALVENIMADRIMEQLEGCRDSMTTYNHVDINQDGRIDGGDVSLVFMHWGTAQPKVDLDHNGTVDTNDFIIVLANWTG
ncbi:MAG: hypothetical protein MK085_06660 [Phycisphaerales bacterium]|nr:hypothetical protein [Phycisphaerales bacterium]